jgi:hypothetical protein
MNQSAIDEILNQPLSQTTLPSAIEELMRQREEGQRS